MNYVKDVPLKTNQQYNMVVEISKGSKDKNELVAPLFDKLVTNKKVKYKYPYNYGIMPGTIGSSDSDPIDVILYSKSRKPLSIVPVQVIGLIKTTDEKGYDPKIICVPVGKKISMRKKIKIINKVTKFITKFKSFKKLEIDNFLYSAQEAETEIEITRKNFLKSGSAMATRRGIK